DRLVEGQRTSWSCRATGALIASLRNRVWDLASPQPLATARITVPLIGNDPVGTHSWPSPSAGPWHADAGEHRDQLRAVMPLSGRDDDGEWPSLPVARQMELGRQPSTTASQPLVAGVGDPLFSSARLRRRRAPLAC